MERNVSTGRVESFLYMYTLCNICKLCKKCSLYQICPETTLVTALVTAVGAVTLVMTAVEL